MLTIYDSFSLGPFHLLYLLFNSFEKYQHIHGRICVNVDIFLFFASFSSILIVNTLLKAITNLTFWLKSTGYFIIVFILAFLYRFDQKQKKRITPNDIVSKQTTTLAKIQRNTKLQFYFHSEKKIQNTLKFVKTKWNQMDFETLGPMIRVFWTKNKIRSTIAIIITSCNPYNITFVCIQIRCWTSWANLKKGK